MGVWWCWRVPGQGEPLDLVAEDWALLQHRIRESLRRAALLQLKARWPHTFGGLAGTIDRRACRRGPRTLPRGDQALRLAELAHRGHMDCFSGGQAAHEAYLDLPILCGASDRGRAAHPLVLRMLDGRKGHMAPMAARGHGQPTCFEHGSR